MNLNKYDIQKPARPPLQDWKESDSVILLSEYLKIKKSFGIRLCQNDGKPFLVFVPPLKKREMDANRWSVAEHALQLFEEAADDLRELLRSGSISLPVLPRRVLPAG